MGDNDIVLGLTESEYAVFGVNANTKNTLTKHLKANDPFSVVGIHKAYNTTVGKINFMVDGMQESPNLTKYLIGENTNENSFFIGY